VAGIKHPKLGSTAVLHLTKSARSLAPASPGGPRRRLGSPPCPRGRPAIANTAPRIFLQEMGAAYDEERGRVPYLEGKHFEETKQSFEGRTFWPAGGHTAR
jgi:hypothetical protein